MIIKTADELHQLVKNVLLAAGSRRTKCGKRGGALGLGESQWC